MAEVEVAESEDALSLYEQERLKKIKRNQEMLDKLGIQPLHRVDEPQVTVSKKRKLPPLEDGRRTKTPKTATHGTATRSSRRMKGLDPNVTDSTEESETTEVNTDVIDDNTLIDPFEYWAARNHKPRIVVDGHFRGWINPELIEKFSLPTSKDEVGKCASNNTAAAIGRARGWSSAKARAAALFKKNPNTYFYRHKAPGEEQWMGEWSMEEYNRFLEIAEKYGCGDSWGLFSSYIPHRVGYQCANFYRQYVLPRGEIVDPNYMFTKNGEAVYVPVNKRRGAVANMSSNKEDSIASNDAPIPEPNQQ